MIVKHMEVGRQVLPVVTGLTGIGVGLVLSYGGGILFSLGGSAYYLIAGVVLVVVGILLILGRKSGAFLYLALYLVTIAWALAEVGVQFWPLVPRIIGPTVLAIPVFLSQALLARRRIRTSASDGGSGRPNHWTDRPALGYLAMTVMVLVLAGFGIGAFQSHGTTAPAGVPQIAPGATVEANSDWTAYGRSNEGRRYAPFADINKNNIERLNVAWTVRTGEIPGTPDADENTPLQAGTRLFACSPHDVVRALDVDSGAVLWTFDPKVKTRIWNRCRGVGYYKDASAGRTGPALQQCTERILLSTLDARLFALDAQTGKPCSDFGSDGQIDLRAGLGEVKPSYYQATSAPTVAKGLVIIGGQVLDNQDVDEPSGVVRAFDVRTGAVRWAWDLGASPASINPPSSGVRFTRGTPNVWAPPSIDERLNLVFLPTGNPTPDHWGGLRSPAMDRYSSSLVALDLSTGVERWRFQTTHHDLWDYDVPSQPTLYDMPDRRGGRIPVVIQATKRGQIFVLDRRTGIPVTQVVERKVPSGGAPGERLAATQPFSIGMPAIGSAVLHEQDMWGLSLLDQLYCRIAFRRLRYDGELTPPTTTPSLLYPGVFGGMNWGGVSIDEPHDYLIVNDIRLGHKIVLVPRRVADREGPAVVTRYGGNPNDPNAGHGGFLVQKGTPFAAVFLPFMSPLGIPCQAPPYGTMTAIDMKTRKVAWQVPLGTTRDSGPLGMKTHVPMPVGLPTIGGSLVTGAGIVFFAGTQDFYLRAIDAGSGRELWKARLPVGAGATPMTYVSPRTRRQYVVISASGARDANERGDFIIAYALRPRTSSR